MRRPKVTYTDGTKGNPVRCDSWSEAFDLARERGRPVYVEVGEFDDANPEGRGTVYPSGHWKEDKKGAC